MLRQIMEVMELLDSAKATGEGVRNWLAQAGLADIELKRIEGEKGVTDFVKALIPSSSRTGPTLGIIGPLGGVGARPGEIGLVSDADGAIVALACAATLGMIINRGDELGGDVIVATHVCPDAPIIPHDPVPFMDSPVDMECMNRYEIDPAMSAILSIDATKGNWVVNARGFAITPTVKEGYILRVSEKLLEIMRNVTGGPPVVFPITTQDITPYGNGLHHINTILQPSVATRAPVVGVATTAAIPVAGCATGSNQILDLETAGRFCLEVAKVFTAGVCPFYDEEEYTRITSLYGSMRHLQTLGKTKC